MNFEFKRSLIPALLLCMLAGLPLCAATLALAGGESASYAQQSHGVAVADMDRSVQPGDDFYSYSNGDWLKRTVIPPDRPSVSVFSMLDRISNRRVAALIEDVAKSPDKSTPGTRKIADLYHSYMDEAGIESKGLTPLRSEFDAISAIHDKRQLAQALGVRLRADEDALNNTNYHTPNFLGLWVAPGFIDSDHYTAYLLQGGIEMPDREYYVQNGEQMQSVRAKYRTHVIAMLKLTGISEPESRADRIIALEHALAEKHWTLAANQDVYKTNNPWRRSEFAVKAPGLDWAEFFRAAGLTSQGTFIVWQPSAIAGESALVGSTPLETWKDWLTYHAIEDYANALPKVLAAERSAFFDGVLTGTEEQAPRGQRAVDQVNFILGDEVGKLYAAKYFPPESKARVQAMVANIIAAFHKRIDALSWMTDATKAQAHAKLSALYVGIGYPETWKDYSALEIKPDDLYGNEKRSELFEYLHAISRLGKPVDRREWCMTPQTVNAVNLPLQNALNFPAAILEPPFFDPQAPDAVNYGAIGSIIGHEVSHTFDSEGSAFDAKGALRNWWTEADLKHFNAATAQLAAQYDQYHPFPDLSLNGQQTLAENIADLAGLTVAYDAYRASLNGKAAPAEEGLSGDQQYFIAFGQAHRSKIRESALRRQVATDEHSPGQYRTDAVRNLDAWYELFQVHAGEKLYLEPKDRVRIW
jgi:endothelin-converting enzyme/putative endopeptidase